MQENIEKITLSWMVQNLKKAAHLKKSTHPNGSFILFFCKNNFNSESATSKTLVNKASDFWPTSPYIRPTVRPKEKGPNEKKGAKI